MEPRPCNIVRDELVGILPLIVGKYDARLRKLYGNAFTLEDLINPIYTLLNNNRVSESLILLRALLLLSKVYVDLRHPGTSLGRAYISIRNIYKRMIVQGPSDILIQKLEQELNIAIQELRKLTKSIADNLVKATTCT